MTYPILDPKKYLENYEAWKRFERRAIQSRRDAADGVAGWDWAQDEVAGLLNAVPNRRKSRDGGVDAWYWTDRGEAIPIQVKMHKRRLGSVDLVSFLGTLRALQIHGRNCPFGVFVCLYPPSPSARSFTDGLRDGEIWSPQVGRVEFPLIQILSAKEMLVNGHRPKLPPVDRKSLEHEETYQLELPFPLTRAGTRK